MNKKNILVIVGICFGLVLSCSGFVLLDKPVLNKPISNLVNDFIAPDDGEWHDIMIMKVKDGKLIPVGEAVPTGGNGFASIFLLDAGQDAFVVLQNNATDWEASGNVLAYADADAFSEDTPSNDVFHIVVRARFTKAVCFDEGDNQFVANRTKCTITYSLNGAASVSKTHYGNLTDGATGGGMPSENDSGHASLWVNFWFEDAGYKIDDDSSLVISQIVISAKY